MPPIRNVSPSVPSLRGIKNYPDSAKKFLLFFGLARVCVCKILCSKDLAADSSSERTYGHNSSGSAGFCWIGIGPESELFNHGALFGEIMRKCKEELGAGNRPSPLIRAVSFADFNQPVTAGCAARVSELLHHRPMKAPDQKGQRGE